MVFIGKIGGQIVHIDLENDTAMIKWETAKKSESVSIEDLQKISINYKSLRTRKPMDFFLPQPDTKIPSTFQSDEYMLMEEEIQNKYYSLLQSKQHMLAIIMLLLCGKAS